MEFVRTTTSDGLVLQGLLSSAESDSVSLPAVSLPTAILHIHGMSGNFWENSFIKTMLKEYPKRGFTFLTVEHRGSELHRWFSSADGSLRLIGNSYEIFEESELDIKAWLSFLIKQGYKKIHLQGHSLGCSKIAYFVSRNKCPEIGSLLLISPADMVGLSIEPNMAEQNQRLLSEASKLSSTGKGKELLSETFWGYARSSADSYLNFFGPKRNTAIFNFFDPSLGFTVVNNITNPLLSILGTKDDGVVTDQHKCNAIFEREAKNCPKFKGVVYDGAAHSFENFEEQIVRDVTEFVSS